MGWQPLLVFSLCVVVTVLHLVGSTTWPKILEHILKTTQLSGSCFPTPIGPQHLLLARPQATGASAPCIPRWFYWSCRPTGCRHLVTCHARHSFLRCFPRPAPKILSLFVPWVSFLLKPMFLWILLALSLIFVLSMWAHPAMAEWPS